jgi:hypothetical protein
MIICFGKGTIKSDNSRLIKFPNKNITTKTHPSKSIFYILYERINELIEWNEHIIPKMAYDYLIQKAKLKYVELLKESSKMCHDVNDVIRVVNIN